MKKGYLLILFALLAALMVACGGATGDTGGATEEPEAEETEAPAEETEAPVEAPEACAEEGACVVLAPGDTIKIGIAAPMTGDVSAYGLDIAQGAEIALEDAGELEGHAFEPVRGDDSPGDAEGGAAVANTLVSEGVVAVVGHAFSGATNAAMPIYETAMIPIMSPSATRIDLTQQGNTIINRVIGNDAVQGELAANFLVNTLGVTKVAIVHDGQAYSVGLAERARDVLGELGAEVVAFEAITPGGTDYSAVLTAVAALEPEALYYAGYTGEAAVIANQRGAAGLGDIPMVSGDGIFGNQFVELAGENAEGVYATSGAFPPESDAKAEFDAKYEAKWGVPTGQLSSYSWYGYDAANVLIEAIKAVAVVGADGTLYIPKADLVAAVRGTTDYQGITGVVSCDENGECSKAGFGVFVVKDGAFVAYEE